MKEIPENKAREERTANTVTVDAYGSEEVMMCWLKSTVCKPLN